MEIEGANKAKKLVGPLKKQLDSLNEMIDKGEKAKNIVRNLNNKSEDFYTWFDRLEKDLGNAGR